MADKFDISEHIKVEALGTRLAEVLSPTQITVNDRVFPAANYSLVPASYDGGTEVFPQEDMDYPYLIEWSGSAILVVWKPISGATSYRYYNGTSSTPGTYTTVASGDFQVRLQRVGPSGSTTFFKFQALIGGTWTDFIARPTGGTYAYAATGTSEFWGWYYPNVTVDSAFGWRDFLFEPTFGTPRTEGIFDVGSGLFKLVFRIPKDMTDVPYQHSVADFTSREKYLIGISGVAIGYPQYFVIPRGYFVNDVSSTDYYLEDTYEVLLPASNFTDPSVKVTVSILRTDDTVDLVSEFFWGPIIPEYEFAYADFVYATGWWPLQCSVSNVDINTGYNEERGLLRRPEPGFASVELKGTEGDPRANTAIQLDNKVRILLAQAASPDNTQDYLFTGFIETMATTYDTFGNANTTLNLVDSLSRILNVNIPTYEVLAAETFSDRMYRVLNQFVAPATWGVTYDDSVYETFQPYDGSTFPPEFREDVTSSDIITELTEGEYGIMGQNRGGVVFWFNRNARALVYQLNEDLINEPFDYGFSTTHSDSLDHFCISDFVIQNSMNDITNKVIATLTYDELTSATYSDATSISRYGERAFDVTLNLNAPAGNPASELEKWVEEVPYFEDQSELQSLTTNVVNREGFVTRAYQIDPLIDAIRVFIATGPVSVNGVWFAKRITHTITPENWTMTLDLSSN